MIGPHYLGVDGGGTKTAFTCIDANRQVVAEAVGGTSYHLQVGLDGALAVLRDGVAEICRQLAITPADFGFAFFGLPAYGEDRLVDPLLERACGTILGHDRYRCGNDMVCGWAGSLGCSDGINLVAGTGSIGYGERCGRRARVGGWGELFSDEGSAYWIALKGLNAFTRMSDDRTPHGPLRDLFRSSLNLTDDIEICAKLMGPSAMNRDEIAALAPLISTAAAQGDAAAGEILEEAAKELAAMAVTLRRALAFPDHEDANLSWSGGVLVHQPIVRDRLTRALDRAGGFRLVEPLHPPSLGAALYALKNAAPEADHKPHT